MNVEFLSKFEKDLGKLKEQSVLDAIADAIADVENAEFINEIRKEIERIQNRLPN